MKDNEQLRFDILDEMPEVPEAPQEKAEVSLASEPLFTALLRNVVVRLWPHDTVMRDFVEYVATPLSEQLAHVAAKGGDFAQERAAEGVDVSRYAADQSQRAHLVNGLFPVLRVAHMLKAWEAPRFRSYDDDTRRLFIAGYVLHDYLKLPDVEAQLEAAGFDHASASGEALIPFTEELFRDWGQRLGLDHFLDPAGGWESWLHDVIYVVANTQKRWGTLRNLGLLPRMQSTRAQLDLATQLSTLADYVAYVAPTPQAAVTHSGIARELGQLGQRRARLVCHHMADNRGVLTNFIHEAALEAMQDEYRVPLLYAPSGVVYLEHTEHAPAPPDIEDVAEATVAHIQRAISERLKNSLTGITRDNKRLKYDNYYWLFFNLPDFLHLGVRATFKNIHEGKVSVASKRYTKIRTKGWLDPSIDLELPEDLRVDQLAEWAYLAEMQIRDRLPDFDTQEFLLTEMDLQDISETFTTIPRDNRAGGMGYHWYFAAGHYLKRHMGLDPAAWRERISDFAEHLATAATAVAHPETNWPDPWADIRKYISQILTLDPIAKSYSRETFTSELHRYIYAKKRGRGTTHMCSLCSSPYTVKQQRETGVLFSPDIYSNKLRLGSSSLKSDICSICSLEIMLRQNLMLHTTTSGKNFEARKVRYLYFYPTYFFTPETLEMVRYIYGHVKRLSFTDLRRQLVDDGGKVNLEAAIWQHLEPLLLDEHIEPEEDRYVRMHFPEESAPTFYFMGVPPPGREAGDAEAWVHPAFLSLVLPLCLDLKVIASESSLPLALEANEFNETVFIDAPHAAIRYLTQGRLRVNVDQLLPTLQRLVSAYLIHTDANTAPGSNDFYRWQDLPALARALDDSPLYAFHYLKKWQRKQKLDTLPASKVRQYLMYFKYLHNEGEKSMSQARELTTLYRQFYRARRRNANAILRPLSIVARTVLEADPRLFDREGLVEAVYGELHSYVTRGAREKLFYFPRGSTWEDREAAMRKFASYFVEHVFYETLRGDKSALRGKQLNLLKSACEVLYRQADTDEWAARDEDADTNEHVDEAEDAA